VNSAAGSFGLSFGLAMAGGHHARRAVLQLHNLTESSTVIPPAQQEQIAALQDDAEVMSNTAARRAHHRPAGGGRGGDPRDQRHARNLSLQVALLVPLLAALLGFANSFRMMRLPDVKPSADAAGLDLG
jgi:hypothetical protein